MLARISLSILLTTLLGCGFISEPDVGSGSGTEFSPEGGRQGALGDAGLDLAQLDGQVELDGGVDGSQNVVDATPEQNCLTLCEEVGVLVPDSPCGFITFDKDECVESCSNLGLDLFRAELYGLESAETGSEELVLDCAFLTATAFSCAAKCASFERCENSIAAQCPSVSSDRCEQICEQYPEEFLAFGPNDAHCAHFASLYREPLCDLCAHQCRTLQGCVPLMERTCPAVSGNECKVQCGRYPDEFISNNICGELSENPQSQSCGHCTGLSDAGTLDHGFYLEGRTTRSGERFERRFNRGTIRVCKDSVSPETPCDYYFDAGSDQFQIELNPRINVAPFGDNPTAVPAYRARVELQLEEIDHGISPVPEIRIAIEGVVTEGSEGPGSQYSGFWWDASFGGSPNITSIHTFASTFAVRHGFFTRNQTDRFQMTLRGLTDVNQFAIVFKQLSLRSPAEHNRACAAKDGCFPSDDETFCEELCSAEGGMMNCIDDADCIQKLGNAASGWDFGPMECSLEPSACRARCLADACDIAYHLDYIKDSETSISHLWVRNWNFTDEPDSTEANGDCCLCGQDNCNALSRNVDCLAL